jgi:hypothetical protein
MRFWEKSMKTKLYSGVHLVLPLAALLFLGAAACGQDEREFLEAIKEQHGFATLPAKDAKFREGFTFSPGEAGQMKNLRLASDEVSVTEDGRLAERSMRFVSKSGGSGALTIRIVVAQKSINDAHESIFVDVAFSSTLRDLTRGDTEFGLRIGDFNFLYDTKALIDISKPLTIRSFTFSRNNVVVFFRKLESFKNGEDVDLIELARDTDKAIQKVRELDSLQTSKRIPEIRELALEGNVSEVKVGSNTKVLLQVVPNAGGERDLKLFFFADKLSMVQEGVKKGEFTYQPSTAGESRIVLVAVNGLLLAARRQLNISIRE